MAISFDETNDYYTIVDHASMTLQDGDWCVGIWTKVDDNTGSDHQYLISTNGTIGANNAFNLWLSEATHASFANRWSALVVDGDGTNPGFLRSTSAPGADGLWRLVIIQHRSADNQIQMWFCQPNLVPVLEDSVADTNFNAANTLGWYIAARADLDAARMWGSICCEFFKGDFSLSSDQIRQLGRGLRIYDLGLIPDVYLQMFSADATLRDVFGSNDATRQDSPTTVDHGPVGTPRPSGAENALMIF